MTAILDKGLVLPTLSSNYKPTGGNLRVKFKPRSQSTEMIKVMWSKFQNYNLRLFYAWKNLLYVNKTKKSYKWTTFKTVVPVLTFFLIMYASKNN